MPFLPTLHAYRSAGRIWPIFIETDSAGRFQTVWLLTNAPDPATDTLYSAYDAIMTVMQGVPEGETYVALCAETLDDKILFSETNQPPDPQDERRIPPPQIINGFNQDPVTNPQFACIIQRLWEPFQLGPNLIGFLTTERPTITRRLGRARGITGQSIRMTIAAPPPQDTVELGRLIRTPRLQPHLTPSTTQPRRPQPLPSPRPSRILTFDPTTGEELDPETGEPLTRTACDEDFIKIPSVDDIVHMRPRPKIPWVQLPDTRTGKPRWTLPRTLTKEEAEEFIRRREISQQIKNSPQPEFARTVAEVMTVIDDTQDALLTAIVFARLGIRSMPPQLQAVLVGGLAVADVMQLMGLGALDLVRVRAIKGRLMKEGAALPFTKKWKVQAARRLLRRIPTIGEAVQILQTTDQMFGIGISLGPILGFILDILFGLGKGAKIGYRQACLDEIRARTIKKLEKWGKIPLGSIPPQKRGPSEIVKIRALLTPAAASLPYQAIMDSILVFKNPQLPASPFTQAEFTHQLAAYNVFLDMVEETTKGENMDELTAAALDKIVKPEQEPGTSTTFLIDQEAIEANTMGRLPFPGTPPELTARETLRQSMTNANQMLLNHYGMDPASIPAYYMAHLAEEIGVKAIRILDPLHEDPKWIPRNAWRTMDAIYNRGFLPPPNATISTIQGALSATLLASDPTTEEPPPFTVMQGILLPLGWTGP